MAILVCDGVQAELANFREDRMKLQDSQLNPDPRANVYYLTDLP